MKCKFLDNNDLHVVRKHTMINFVGSIDNYKMIDAAPNIEFDIIRYEEFPDYYNIVVFDSSIGICDGGDIEQLINIPKSFVTISGKKSIIEA